MQPLYPECRELNIVLDGEDKFEPALLASSTVFDQAFTQLDLPANVYTFSRIDSNESCKQLVAWQAGNLSRDEPSVGNIIRLIVGAEYNTQTTLSGIPAMAMAHVQPLALDYAMFVNPFATNAVKTIQIHYCWYEEIARIDTAQKNSDPPCAYISAVNE